jgi:hypothetical protein
MSQQYTVDEHGIMRRASDTVPLDETASSDEAAGPAPTPKLVKKRRKKVRRLPSAPAVGWLPPALAEHGLVWLMRTAGLLLVAASVIGTFYAVQQKAIEDMAKVLDALAAAPDALLMAIGIQIVLSVGQWGARQRASRDQPKYWLAYLALVGFSAALNLIAYLTILAVVLPYWLAFAIIVIADIVAEFLIVAD